MKLNLLTNNGTPAIFLAIIFLFFTPGLTNAQSASLKALGQQFCLDLQQAVDTLIQLQSANDTLTSPVNYRQHYIYHGPREANFVALTYDDGPSGDYTQQLLQLLQEEDVPATFFFLAERVRLYPAEARMVAEAGCEIGLHGLTHRHLTGLRTEEMKNELHQALDIIETATSKTAVLFRPPFGNCNFELTKASRELGLNHVIFWDLDTRDWDRNTTTSQIIDFVVQKARPGSIILFHDWTGKSRLAAKEIIPRLRQKGLQFCTVSFLLYRRQYLALLKPLMDLYGLFALLDLSPVSPMPSIKTIGNAP